VCLHHRDSSAAERNRYFALAAHLTSDEEDIQRVACDTECLNKVMALAKAVDKDDPSKPMAENLKARTKEVRQ
jgi:hypothetical protein